MRFTAYSKMAGFRPLNQPLQIEPFRPGLPAEPSEHEASGDDFDLAKKAHKTGVTLAPRVNYELATANCYGLIRNETPPRVPTK